MTRAPAAGDQAEQQAALREIARDAAAYGDDSVARGRLCRRASEAGIDLSLGEAGRLIDEMRRSPADGVAGPGEWPDEPAMPGPPDPDPLPLDALPSAVKDHVASVADATQTPTELPALLSLACVSAAVGGRVIVDVDARGWREPAHIYTTVILPPASRKSPVYQAMTAPIAEWEREERERIGPAYRRGKDRVDVVAANLQAAKAAATKGKASMHEVDAARRALDEAEAAVPILPRLIASDATPEALVRLMAQQGGRIALMAPEGDPLRIADGRYSEGTARLGELKQAWSGEAITVDRVGREPVEIPRPALTLALTMQPGVLETLKNARTMRGEGVFGRILWCIPPHGLGARLTGRRVPMLDSDAAARYGRVLHVLLDGAAFRPTDRKHEALRLSSQALEVLYAYEEEVECELADGGRLAGIRDWAGKVCGQSIRLAALVELATRADDGRHLYADPIELSSMHAGVRLARALTTHALVVLNELEIDRPTADLRYLLRRATELPAGSTLRDLYESTKGRTGIDSMEDLRPLVDGLVARGCLRVYEPTRPGRGRRPSPKIEVHPAILDSHSQNSQNSQRFRKSLSRSDIGQEPEPHSSDGPNSQYSQKSGKWHPDADSGHSQKSYPAGSAGEIDDLLDGRTP